MSSEVTPEFSRKLPVHRGVEPLQSFKIEATTAERAALAKRFDLIALDSFTAEGALTTLDGGTVSAGKTWAPSPKLSTTLSQLNSLVGAKSIAIKLTAVSGSVEVDDLYIDPFLAR